jgi:methionyl aminopeptidase
MIRLKTENQINGIRKSAKALSAMFRDLVPQVQAGVSTGELDHFVRKWIKNAGAEPVLLGYGPKRNPFPAAICISVNEEVIHGIPGKRKLRTGEIVSLDCEIGLDGWVSDQTVTVEVGKVSPEAHRLNVVTKECLTLGIQAVKAGDRLLNIARAVEGHAREAGYGVVSDFCGHGVGFDVHEDPAVVNTPHGPNPKMRGGMVIAIEPMINQGTGDIDELDDGWTIVTADGKLACHWEHTVAIFSDHTEVLTEDIF